MSVNKTILTGRLVNDLELRALPSGQSVAVGRLAVDDAGNGKDDNDKQKSGFFNIVSYGPSAEAAARYTAKGSLVAVDGRLQHETWNDKTTGETRQSVSIVGHIEFLADARDRGNSRQQQQESTAETDKEEDRATKASKAPEAIPNVKSPVAAAAGAER